MAINCKENILKDSITDNSLRKLGEICIEAKSINASDYSSIDKLKKIVLNNTKPFTVRTTGNGKFGTDASSLTLTEQTFSANTNITLFFSNGNYLIFVSEKYTLYRLSIAGYSDGDKIMLFHFNTSELSESTAIDRLELSYGGDNLQGDISNIGTTNIDYFDCTNSAITGDIQNISVMSNLRCQGSKVYGDFSDALENTSTVAQLFKGGKYSQRDGGLTADFSVCSANVTRFDTGGLAQDVACRWENTRPSSRTIIPLVSYSYAKFSFGDYLDAMLINQAGCENDTSKSSTLQSTISVYGNRTSASDLAVATLKEYGYTIIINGETL